MTDWRQSIRDVLKGLPAVSFYSADPGATAYFKPVMAEAEALKIARTWYVDGWAAQQEGLPLKRSAENMVAELVVMPEGSVLAMGQQVDFKIGHQRLEQALVTKVAVYFFSDHWEDITGLFRPTSAHALILPHRLYVPDEKAKITQVAGLMKLGVLKAQCEKMIRIFPHPGLETSLEQIGKITPDLLGKLRGRFTPEGKKLVLVALDPDRACFPDYDWRRHLDAVAGALQREDGAVYLVKPHPRTPRADVERYAAPIKEKFAARLHLVDGPAEPYVAIADEVWGARSILLPLAQRVGKAVRVFSEAAAEPARKAGR